MKQKSKRPPRFKGVSNHAAAKSDKITRHLRATGQLRPQALKYLRSLPCENS